MTGEWWGRRNNRRVCRLPDLNAPGEPKLPGTPEMRIAACLAHGERYMRMAQVRAAQKRAWLAAQEEE